MKLFKILIALAILGFSMISLSTAKMEYSKKEGKNCKYCHSAMPPSAKNLNDTGKCYQANKHSLDKCKPPAGS